jgi:hypothetical protein
LILFFGEKPDRFSHGPVNQTLASMFQLQQARRSMQACPDNSRYFFLFPLYKQPVLLTKPNHVQQMVEANSARFLQPGILTEFNQA